MTCSYHPASKVKVSDILLNLLKNENQTPLISFAFADKFAKKKVFVGKKKEENEGRNRTLKSVERVFWDKFKIAGSREANL